MVEVLCAAGKPGRKGWSWTYRPSSIFLVLGDIIVVPVDLLMEIRVLSFRCLVGLSSCRFLENVVEGLRKGLLLTLEFSIMGGALDLRDLVGNGIEFLADFVLKVKHRAKCLVQYVTADLPECGQLNGWGCFVLVCPVLGFIALFGGAKRIGSGGWGCGLVLAILMDLQRRVWLGQ